MPPLSATFPPRVRPPLLVPLSTPADACECSGRLLGIQCGVGRARGRIAWVPRQVPRESGSDVPAYCHLDAGAVARVGRCVRAFLVRLLGMEADRVDLSSSSSLLPRSSLDPRRIVTSLHHLNDRVERVDATLEHQIRSSQYLIPLATRLSTLSSSSSSHGGDGPNGTATTSSAQSVSSDGEDEGEGEIMVLAKRVLDILDGTLD